MSKLTDKIKLALLQYYRYERSMIVGTEVTMIHGIADILAYNDRNDYSVEVEVKTSISDLRADFNNKKNKHGLITKDCYDTIHFYFCVPEDLYEDAKRIILENGNQYGILKYIDQPCDKKIIAMVKPKKLRDSTHPSIPHCLYMRLSSEVATLRKAIFEKQKRKNTNSFSEFVSNIKE